MLKLALKACCKNCTRLFYQKPFKSMVELSTQFYNASYYQVLIPAIGIKEARYYFSNPYVRLINSPGVAFIYPDNIGDVVMDKLLKSLYETWPLFALILLLTIQGGVIIWLLVNHFMQMLHQLEAFKMPLQISLPLLSRATGFESKAEFLKSLHGL